MSVNSYTKGCHLLNHDDVIGTRRVSYILYMPLPHYQLWQKDWGGALELYPVKQNGPDGELEPEPVPAKSIPPSWNQFIFFEVQPGRSFHSVEEVVVGGDGEDGRQRLSISGWFHAAQEGEEGYVPEQVVPQAKSSREQLVSNHITHNPMISQFAPLDVYFHSFQLVPVVKRATSSRKSFVRRSCCFPIRIPQPRLSSNTYYESSFLTLRGRV
jgi:prolyl 3-hydroxylase /prolyl 3,4-dihydroxylase